MKMGIKTKILLVLAGSLILTTALHVALASYFTDRQNQEAAFAALDRDLLGWQNELQDLTLQLRDSALATVSDSVVLDQLAELAELQFTLEDTIDRQGSWETAKTQAYIKSVSINRLRLVLKTSGFSSVDVYTDGKLSHHVSDSEAGMMVRRREGAQPVWLRASVDSNGRLPIQSWPAWDEGRPLAIPAPPMVKQLSVSFAFPEPGDALIQIAIPVQGVFDEILTDSYNEQRKTRYFSNLSIAGLAPGPPAHSPPAKPPVTFSVIVFSRTIDRMVLEKVSGKTGKLPVLFSPDGRHRQQLTDLNLVSDDLLRNAQARSPSLLGPARQHAVVTTNHGSLYAALRPWVFEGQPRLILGLASSRDTTLQNIRQTVSAILMMTGLILLLSLGLGGFLVGRVIDPIIALTAAVSTIGLKGRSGVAALPAGESAFRNLHPIAVEASDEVGDLGRAFNAMITELRQTLETLELRVQERTAELRQQKRYLRTLIDTLPLLTWFKDPQSYYLAINQAVADACGRPQEEIIGKSDLMLWPHDLAESYRADDAEVMATRQRKTKEEPVADVKGGTRWMETYKAPVVDEDGTVLGTVGVARDISARKATEAAREAALAEAERLARVRSEFLAQMSHELRTPLNGILGYAQILQRDKTLSERQLTGLGIIQQSGEHLLTLINDILDFAKVEAGKLELLPADISLGAFLRVIANIISIKAEQKDLMFTVEASPDLPEGIRADEKRLRQVLLNLLANAVKFTDRGQVIFRVRPVSPTRLRFEIQDTGIGIGADQLKLLFQPFEQVGPLQQRAGGTGLGLAISQQLVRLMGSDIHVESQFGQGSTFWFELEAVPVVVPGGWVQPAKDGIITGYSGPRKRVLVVDDLPENRGVVVAMLEQLGFEMIEAENGREGLEKVGALHPDLILMDIVMPEMGGLEATRRLRESAEFKDVPIIAISASASDHDTKECLAAGVNTFLPKPIVMARLLDEIGSLLRITWIYALVAEAAVPAAETGPLVAPPQEEMEVLHHLARRGRMHDIVQWADHAAGLDARHQPFVNRLRALAKSYQSKAILSLVEQHMKPAQAR